MRSGVASVAAVLMLLTACGSGGLDTSTTPRARGSVPTTETTAIASSPTPTGKPTSPDTGAAASALESYLRYRQTALQRLQADYPPIVYYSTPPQRVAFAREVGAARAARRTFEGVLAHRLVGLRVLGAKASGTVCVDASAWREVATGTRQVISPSTGWIAYDVGLERAEAPGLGTGPELVWQVSRFVPNRLAEGNPCA